MVQESKYNPVRVNARRSDIFDIFNIKYFLGPNPYLDRAALVFDFAITGDGEARLEDFISVIGDRYPHLLEESFTSHAHLFARTVSEVGKLDMGLHFNHWNIASINNNFTIAVQTLHARTQRAVVYCVWDWFEAINKGEGEDFPLKERIRELQNVFRQSVYGGPTVYSLLRAADHKGIPAFYLWEEGLMQYGYGKKLVRGIATTFDCDSHIDSDFTTRKDDCKAVLKTLGFPVPSGEIVISLKEALIAAEHIGYPVAIKPVVGHKGIGVTADIQNEKELESAYRRAVKAIPEEQSIRIIVEKSISGSDFRLLCVNGRFVAATERRPASVVGDGYLTIRELIRRENRSSARLDTPTSPMSKIQCDEAMDLYLEEQGLSLDSVIEKDQVVYLRKVANLSAGGVSIDATKTVHPDNIILAQDIAQHFRLTCLGIDVIAKDLSTSWKSGSFSILEINAAPGIFMHLNPAIGESVDVPSHILETFFHTGADARIPIITFSRISVQELQETIDHILLQKPDWTIGAICGDGIFINRSPKIFHKDYNTNVQNLLRNPKVDLLIVEYNEDILQKDGMFYYGSNMVVLDNPSETEIMLKRDVFENSTVIIKEQDNVSIFRHGLMEQYNLGEAEPFSRVYLKEVHTIL